MHLSAKQISDAKPGPIDVGKRKWRLAIPLANSLGGICLFGLLLLVSLLPRRDDPSDYFLGFVLGLIFMQISLHTYWLVLGPGPMNIRLPLTLLTLVIGPTALMRNFVSDNQLEMAFLIWFLLVFFVLHGLLVGVCWAGVKFFRWRVRWRDCHDQATRGQFSTRDLLLWMIGIGMLLTTVRVAFQGIGLGSNHWDSIREDAISTLILIVATLVLAILAGWIAWDEQSTTAWIGKIFLSVAWSFVSALFLAASSGEMLLVFSILSIQFLGVWTVMRLLRWQGLEWKTYSTIDYASASAEFPTRTTIDSPVTTTDSHNNV